MAKKKLRDVTLGEVARTHIKQKQKGTCNGCPFACEICAEEEKFVCNGDPTMWVDSWEEKNIKIDIPEEEE